MSPVRESVGVVIVAAGPGTRMGGTDKVFAPLAGRPVLAWSLAAFQSPGDGPAIERIAVVVSQRNLERARVLIGEYGFGKATEVCTGGERRQDSVARGLETLKDCDRVLVHDGARPLVTRELIQAAVEASWETGAAVPALPVADTVKRVREDMTVEETVDRSRLYAVQTPQGFRYDLLSEAHRRVAEDVTDDAAMLEKLGHAVKVFPGSRLNIKITTREDLRLAEALLAVRDSMLETR